MERDFERWFSTFRKNIMDYKFFVNFGKVYSEVSSIEACLKKLNSLIGSPNIKDDFRTLVKEEPETLACIPILLAVRSQEINVVDDKLGELNYSFLGQNYSVEQYCIFMEKTGLFDLLQNHIVDNLVDYVIGVETGLDSNARKNRSGKAMEELVEINIHKCGFEKGVNYFKEMTIREAHKRWGIDFSPISNKGKVEKRFDFVVKTFQKTYFIETNFYTGGGSKLNEIARSYKALAIEFRSIQDTAFVWFTDGYGWTKAKHNLEEAFDAMEHIYNIKDIEDGIMKRLFV